MGKTQSLAKEVAPDNITVNAICPGIIRTDMSACYNKVWGEMLGNFVSGEFMESWVQNIPMKRAGAGKDLAGLIAFPARKDTD